MVLLHILGAVIVLFGLVLFAADQLRGKKWSDSAMSAWKLNISGPPALVLVFLGVLVFALPFTPWLAAPEDPSPPTVVTTTPFSGGSSTTAAVSLLPDSPSGFQIYFDEGCGGPVVDWSGDDLSNVAGWVVSVEVYEPDGTFFTDFELDSQTDFWTFGNQPFLCYWDFALDGPFVYWFWIWPWNDAGFAESPLFVEFSDV